MPSLSLYPSLRSRASSHSNMLHARSPASGSPSPGGGMERSLYFMTSASAASPSAEMARYGGCTSNPWMNVALAALARATRARVGPWIYLPLAGVRVLSARGADIGSYFSPWSSECAHTPPLGSRGPDDELIKTSEQDGFFAQGITHTSSSTSSTTASAAVPQIHLQHRHTHAHNPTRPHLRLPPPRSTVTFPLTMAVAQGKYHPSNYRNLKAPTSQPTTATASVASSPVITTSSPSAASPPTTQLPSSPPAQAPDTRRLLLQYQRDMVEAAARAAQLSISRSPASPRLGPLGSPGPVTPWELEGEGSSGGWLERKGSVGTETGKVEGGKEVEA
ncbi:hypothetical protein V502_01199 [Pseudogymnoascus sp. VKM F-4520 (FW-2644)]|nr:hypothetical protein V502_01199 [Pseudogymnoascus sp. VKM F-4520 (FW-2644)]